MTGPCLCGDPGCPNCGDPAAMATQDAEENLMETLNDSGCSVYELSFLIDVAPTLVKALKDHVDSIQTDQDTDDRMENVSLQARIDELEETVRGLRMTLKGKDGTIYGLQESVRSKGKRIEGLEEAIRKKDKRINEYKEALSNSDLTIAELRSKLDDTTATCNELTRTNKALKKQLDAYEYFFGESRFTLA